MSIVSAHTLTGSGVLTMGSYQGKPRGGFVAVCRSSAVRRLSRQRVAAHRSSRDGRWAHLLPFRQVDDYRFAVEAPAYWFDYTHGHGSHAIIAAAVVGSGVDGRTVSLAQCGARPPNYRMYVGKLRPSEYNSLMEFGHEIRASSFAVIARTAVVVGLGLAYGRDGVTNGRAKVSCAYIESIMSLSGRLTDDLLDRVGRPLLSLLLACRQSGGPAAVQAKIQPMLDHYSPRHLNNVLDTLDWYEQTIADEADGILDRRTHLLAS